MQGAAALPVEDRRTGAAMRDGCRAARRMFQCPNQRASTAYLLDEPGIGRAETVILRVAGRPSFGFPALPLEFLHPCPNDGKVVRSAHAGFLPGFAGVNGG